MRDKCHPAPQYDLPMIQYGGEGQIDFERLNIHSLCNGIDCVENIGKTKVARFIGVTAKRGSILFKIVFAEKAFRVQKRLMNILLLMTDIQKGQKEAACWFIGTVAIRRCMLNLKIGCSWTVRGQF